MSREQQKERIEEEIVSRWISLRCPSAVISWANHLSSVGSDRSCTRFKLHEQEGESPKIGIGISGFQPSGYRKSWRQEIGNLHAENPRINLSIQPLGHAAGIRSRWNFSCRKFEVWEDRRTMALKWSRSVHLEGTHGGDLRIREIPRKESHLSTLRDSKNQESWGQSIRAFWKCEVRNPDKVESSIGSLHKGNPDFDMDRPSIETHGGNLSTREKSRKGVHRNFRIWHFRSFEDKKSEHFDIENPEITKRQEPSIIGGCMATIEVFGKNPDKAEGSIAGPTDVMSENWDIKIQRIRGPMDKRSMHSGIWKPKTPKGDNAAVLWWLVTWTRA